MDASKTISCHQGLGGGNDGYTELRIFRALKLVYTIAISYNDLYDSQLLKAIKKKKKSESFMTYERKLTQKVRERKVNGASERKNNM